MRSLKLGDTFCRASVVLVCIIVIGGLAPTVRAADRWHHYSDDRFEYWDLDGNYKFRWTKSDGQWCHFSTYGLWNTLSTPGLPSDPFIGDGSWHDMGYGLRYRYDLSNDYGFFVRGSLYRFFYGYTLGQWYTSGCGGGWYKVGAAGLSAGVLGDGNVHDVGNGLKYRYGVEQDYGFYYLGILYRFYYRYTPGQWYTSGYAGGWYNMGGTELCAGVLADGNVYDLGNGAKFRYDAVRDYGFYYRGGHYRFHYQYTPGQWYTSGNGGGWYTIGAAGVCAGVAGGGVCDLGNGLKFRYDADKDYGFYYRGSLYRFYYRYTPGQWFTSGHGGGWYVLGGAGLNAGTLLDGRGHDLGNGWSFSYLEAGDLGTFISNENAFGFRYEYTQGQWGHKGLVGGWGVLGNASINASFVGDGGLHEVVSGDWWYKFIPDEALGQWFLDAAGTRKRFSFDYVGGQWAHYNSLDGFATLGPDRLSLSTVPFMGAGGPHEVIPEAWWYAYNHDSDLGEWYDEHGTIARLGYGYLSGQWNDYVTGRGWMLLGATGRPIDFIGADGLYRDLGDGFQYKYESGLGYFLFDAAHNFRQWYATGAWQYQQDAGWHDWSTAVLLKDINASGGSTPSYFIVGAYLYFIANDGTGRDLYQWDGNTFRELSGNKDFGSLSYITATGSDLYFKGGYYTGGEWQYNIYRLSGTIFEQAFSEYSYFNELTYFTTADSNLYFKGGFYWAGQWRYNLYRLSGITLDKISDSMNFNELAYMTTIGTILYFSGGFYNPVTYFNEYDLYQWDGDTFAEISGGRKFHGLDFCDTVGTDLYFRGAYYNSNEDLFEFDLYQWDGYSIDNVSGGRKFHYLSYLTTVGTDLYFSAGYTNSQTACFQYDLYQWDGGSFANISEGKNFDRLIYCATEGTNLYFSAGYFNSETYLYEYDLYRWDNITFTFADISGNKRFAELDYFTSVGSDLYFGAYGGEGTGWDVYCWNGASFDDISENMDFEDLKYFTMTGTYLYFGASDSGAGWEVYSWNGDLFDNISGSEDFDSVDYLTTVGTDLFFSGGFYNSEIGYTEYDLYRWNGATFADISGNRNFDHLNYFATAGTDLYVSASFYNPDMGYSEYDLYRWHGSNFNLVADLKSYDVFGSPVIYSGDLYFSAVSTAYGWEPWRAWATHMDFLSSRMP